MTDLEIADTQSTIANLRKRARLYSEREPKRSVALIAEADALEAGLPKTETPNPVESAVPVGDAPTGEPENPKPAE